MPVPDCREGASINGSMPGLRLDKSRLANNCAGISTAVIMLIPFVVKKVQGFGFEWLL